MHRQAQPQGGLRLAYADLPPTLQPHAILSVAPRPDRRISALAATVIYLGLASGIVLLGRQRAVVRVATERDPSPIIELTPDWKPIPPPRHEPPAHQAVATTQPPDTRPLPPESLVPPEDTPTRLPIIDNATIGTRPPTDEERRDGKVANSATPGGKNGSSTSETSGTSAARDFTANPPRVLTAVNPAYPAMARISHLQGPVVLLMTIDEHGVPALVQVLSGHAAFHAEAERAARLWRFEPATVEGRPVPARFRLTISFRLT